MKLSVPQRCSSVLLSADPHCGHVADFATFIADFRDFWSGWAAAAAGPRVLMGHSMGGHLVLRALAEGAAHPDAAVRVAPMLGLGSPLGARGGGWQIGREAWRGRGGRVG